MTDAASDPCANAENEKKVAFGTRLKQARESLGLEHKEVATHLRLNEKIILMMERDRYPADLPVTFVKGYLRAYAKYLSLPETEIAAAIEPIKSKHPNPDVLTVMQPITALNDKDNRFLKVFTYLGFLMVLSLVSIWYYSQHQTSTTEVATKQTNIIETGLTQQQLQLLAHGQNTFMTFAQPVKQQFVFNNARILKRHKNRDKEIDIDLYN